MIRLNFAAENCVEKQLAMSREAAKESSQG
jgi:hypothetical protein